MRLTGLLLAVGLAFALSAAAASVTVGGLHCEYLDNPLGIDTAQPRLSWVLESKQRGQAQSAYQVLVASSKALLKANTGDLRDSGRVTSDQTLHVAYTGKALRSCQRCYWKVRAWDKEGKASAYSEPAYWEMGLLSPQDWKGQWIGRTTDTNSLPAPLLCRTFTLEGKIKQARAYICGLGYLDEYCGDTKVLCDHYDGMKRYVDYLTSKVKEGIVDIGLNDWAPFKTATPADITSTAYYYRDLQVVALTAKLMGNEADARKYNDLATSIKQAFNGKFYQTDSGLHGNGSQTSLSCAL